MTPAVERAMLPRGGTATATPRIGGHVRCWTRGCREWGTVSGRVLRGP
ncbi:hypothetical protein FHU38_003684 [Saccharomonospora amisosensis]|uniref:Uncharacterized protein n=1 Tax=Saccharomonospora amisosensis TaxID=1128677 RepID=A0A7X5USF4_9PSEU|nr:hypothetical protein [Saccharomonospora amisosensis]NIJ13340.1 hypothetical protein [Saccharomonospora amisosensis]